MNRTRTWLELLILLLVCALLWFAFALWKPFKGVDLSGSISIEQEEKLGRMMMESLGSIDPMYQYLEDSVMDEAIAVISRRLLDNIGLTDYEYNIRIVKSSQVNAFTIPGGNILVCKGLLDVAETPEQVAAVIAHEIGHVEKRHVVDKLVREIGLSMMLSMITGGDPYLMTDLLETIFKNSFSRKAEEQADEYALALLERSRLSPSHLAGIFKVMKKESFTMSENLEFIQTHPHINSRIRQSMEYKVEDDFEEETIGIAWPLTEVEDDTQ